MRPSIGRRSFLLGRFFAHVLGEVPREVGAVPSSDAVPSLRPLARRADEPAPFRRRVDVRAILASSPRVARVDRFACLASNGAACSSCVEHCPVPDALVLRAGVPAIDPRRCDGCGACERACPAPGGAIRTLPVIPPETLRGPR